MTEKLTLKRPEAAALCSLTPSGFDRWVRLGLVPAAMAGTRRWSRAALERAIAGEPDKPTAAYKQWKAEDERKQRLKGVRLPDSTPEHPARPLGKREREMLHALRAAGGKVDNPGLVPGGLVTTEKLGLRGYLEPDGGFYRLALTQDGKLAAELINR